MTRGLDHGRELTVDMLDETAEARFMAKTAQRGEHLVWVGAGAATGSTMFLACGQSRLSTTAARVMWVLRHGSLAENQNVIRTCSTDNCLTHLEIGTAADVQGYRRDLKAAAPTVERVRTMRQAGHSHAEIMAETGLSRGRVSRMANNHTYPDSSYRPTRRKGGRFNRDQVTAIRRRHLDGENVRTLAREFAIPDNSMSELLHGKTYPTDPLICGERHNASPS